MPGRKTVTAPSSKPVIYADLKAAKLKRILTPPDPEPAHCARDVGTIFPPDFRAAILKPTLPQLAAVAGNVKFQVTEVPRSSGIMVIIANLFGWTGAQSSSSAAEGKDG